MTSVLREICDWASTLPYWEQAALDKILSGVSFTDADYDELLRYLLEDADLAEPTGPRPTLHFPQYGDADSQPMTPVRLVKISGLRNINALVQGQVLTFDPALTAIYGGTGSGKSGYARVLGCAGFTRGDEEVLPDITQPADDTVTLSADIGINDGTSDRTLQYEIGKQCAELASCYVFDSTSVRVHLTGQNAFSFSPAGLSHLARMAEVTDKVRDRLQTRVDENSQPHEFDAWFQGDTEVRELVADLGPDTDLRALREMAQLAPEEEQRLQDLDLDVARLKTEDIPKQIGDLTQRIEDLGILTSRLQQAQEALSSKAVDEIVGVMRIYVERQVSAEQVSIDRFESERFTQTGTDVWHQFVAAARALAEAEQIPDQTYPQPDDRCLLCHQPLSAQARELLLRLWEFLEGEARTRLQEAQALVVEKEEALDGIDLDFFDDESVSYRYLQTQDARVLGKVKAFVAACRRRRKSVRKMISAGAPDSEHPSLPASGISDLERLVESLRTDLAELEKKDPTEDIAELEQQKLSLEHRALLHQRFDKIEEYVQKRLWAQQAKQQGGTTRHITTKHNQLFRRLVTDRYVELFEQTLRDLGRPLQVRVKTRGRKGEAHKQILLQADSSVPTQRATVDKVLSEGEKRAVALADFLTEVALDNTSGTIVLDDPVTSLDLEWRELIASILAAEAKRRQVIVFTHDLPFLYHLTKYSEREQVEVATHWIKRGDHDGRPGYVFLDNSPALEREYRKATRVREIYARAKDAPAADQEALLREGFGALRTCYEAFIIFDLFNEVVMRFDERVSIGRLMQIVWDKSIVDEVVAKCELLSRYIEGHLHSNALGAQKPQPRTLLTEIEAFDALRKRLTNLRKSSA